MYLSTLYSNIIFEPSLVFLNSIDPTLLISLLLIVFFIGLLATIIIFDNNKKVAFLSGLFLVFSFISYLTLPFTSFLLLCFAAAVLCLASYALFQNRNRSYAKDKFDFLRHKQIIDNLPDGIMLYDPEKNEIIQSNAPLEGLLDLSNKTEADSLNRKVYLDEVLFSKIGQLTDKQLPFEKDFRLLSAKGNEKWLHLVCDKLYNNAASSTLILRFSDISEYKRTILTNSKSLESLQHIVNSSPLMILFIDTDGKIRIQAGKGYKNFSSKRSIIGRSIYELFPDDLTFHEILNLALQGETISTHTKKKNACFEMSFSPFSNLRSKLIGTLCVVYDMTEKQRVETELKLNLSKLERNNKELEHLTKITSHDLKEPLRTITSYIQLLDRNYADQLDEAAKSYIDFAVSGTKSLHQRITALSKYADLMKYHVFTPVDCNKAILFAQDKMQNIISHKRASIIISKSLPTVSGIFPQIVQLFCDLLENALQYNISDNPYIEINFQKKGSFYEFSVSDNGIGIPEEIQTKVFDMFSKSHILPTNEKSSGVGMGLALCKKIIDRHNGQIWFESSKSGSTFYFELPQTVDIDDNVLILS